MAETQNIPHLDLKFYNSSATLPGVVPNNANAITLAFDKANDLIGINNFWFGSKHLPLTGGLMTGPISWSSSAPSGDAANASLILNGKPILIDGGATTDNTLRYFVNWEAVGGNTKNTIVLGNYKMLSAWRTWQNTTTPKQTNIEHWVSSTNRNDGVITKYTILDTNNTYLTNYSSNDTQYGYTLTLPHVNNNGNNQTFNLLGIGQLHPAIEFGTNENAGKVRITVGGDTSSFVDVNAKYAQQASSAVGVTNLYFDVDDNNNIITKSQATSLVSSKNKIEVSSDLKVEKIPATDGGSITNNPTSWKLKISLSDTFLQRITNLENKHDVSLSFIE